MQPYWTVDLSLERNLYESYKDTDPEFANAIKPLYSKHEGKVIKLLTLAELNSLVETAPETILITISGEEVLAKDANEDVRMGYVSTGILVN